MVNLAQENLTNKVLELRKQNVPYDEISTNLEKQGYAPTQRDEAINQSKLASGSVGYPHDESKVNEDEPPAPSNAPETLSTEDISSLPATNSTQQQPKTQKQPQRTFSSPQIPEFTPMPQFTSSVDPTQVQAVIESIIEEKWNTFVQDLGDYKTWKEKTELQLKAIKQEIIRTQTRFEVMEKSILGKVKDYDNNITEFSTDVKALSKVFQKILEPLKENINELSRITKELKK